MIKTNLINKINKLSIEMRIYGEQRLNKYLIEIDRIKEKYYLKDL